jgi:hypothetical protein
VLEADRPTGSKLVSQRTNCPSTRALRVQNDGQQAELFRAHAIPHLELHLDSADQHYIAGLGAPR